MGNLASLTFMLGANIKDFQTKMRQAAKEMDKAGQQMKGIGKSMSMYVTAPLVAMGAASLAAFDKQAQAEAKLAAQVRLNGKDVESTMASYKTFASELQNVTTVGDETTLGLMQMAETMGATNVQAATQGAIALSKALGVDLAQGVKMAVMAQSGQYEMLNRYVPALRTANSESEKAAIVSKLYADGLAIAKTEAETGMGAMIQLTNTLGDIGESFGAIIAEGIKPAVEWLKSIAAMFQNLSERGKTAIVIVSGIAATIGPLLVVLGTLATLLPTIAAGFAMITGPVGLAVLAIIGIAAAFMYVWDNFQAFKERLTDWSWLKNAVIDAAQFIMEALTIMWRPILDALGIDFITPAIDLLDNFKSEVTGTKTEFKSFGATLKSVGGQAMDALGLMGTEGEKSFEKITVSAVKSVRTIAGAINKMTSKSGSDGIAVDITPELLMDEGKMNNLLDAAAINYLARIQKFGKVTVKNWDDMMEGINAAITNTIVSLGVGIGEMLGDMITGIDPNFGASVLNMLGSFLKQIGTMMITYGALMLAMTLLMENPWTAAAAIIVGIAAVAAGQALMNQSAKGMKMAKGGIVPPGFGGDTYPALLSSGETVIPAPIPLSSVMGRGGSGGELNVKGTISGRGRDMMVTIDRARIDSKRTRGY